MWRNNNQRVHRNLHAQRLLLLLLVSSVTLSACATKPYRGAATQSDKQQLLHIAKSMLGVPYRYGGSTPKSGFDCSGLVQYAYQRVGVSVPRTTGELYRAAMPISHRALQPGDLVFFRTKKQRFVSHVGIYLGRNRFIHAPSSGKKVSIASFNNPYWRKHFTSGGRIY